MVIEDNCAVGIHYTLTSDSGDVIDSSQGRDPLVYLHGVGMLVPGLERELAGRTVGEELQVVVQPEEGYGQVDPELVQEVSHEVLAGVDGLQVGMQLEAHDPEGQVRLVLVREIADEHVVLDANPPLAGMVLHFEIKIDSIREATPEELDHGHVH